VYRPVRGSAQGRSRTWEQVATRDPPPRRTAALLVHTARPGRMERAMERQAKGDFEVRRTPQEALDAGDGVQVAHVRFDKRFHGPLDATSVVHMLAVGTDVPGSAAYVAIERIAGTLDGREGSFLAQHGGTMDRGQPTLSVTVVPDSGTGALAGLRGRMAIDIVDGAHSYTFDYRLDDPLPQGD
jgi:hypothetical protein